MISRGSICDIYVYIVTLGGVWRIKMGLMSNQRKTYVYQRHNNSDVKTMIHAE